VIRVADALEAFGDPPDGALYASQGLRDRKGADRGQLRGENACHRLP